MPIIAAEIVIDITVIVIRNPAGGDSEGLLSGRVVSRMNDG